MRNFTIIKSLFLKGIFIHFFKHFSFIRSLFFLCEFTKKKQKKTSKAHSFSKLEIPLWQGLARFILVIQKHPKLVTYMAQAYHVKCTYSTGERTISLGFNVSMLTTAGTIANTGPPPRCLMKITNQRGGDISQAEIGDLLHLNIIVEPSGNLKEREMLQCYGS